MGYTPAHFEVRKVGTATTIYPFGATGDTLTIRANPADTTASITLYGGGTILLETNAADPTIQFRNGTTIFGKVLMDTVGDIQFISMANKNIALLPNGSGLVKFGAKTAHADQAVDGYVTFKLADNTTAYLATLTPV